MLKSEKKVLPVAADLGVLLIPPKNNRHSQQQKTKEEEKDEKREKRKSKAPIIFDFLSLGSSWSLIENLFLFSGVSVFVEMNVAAAEQKCCFA